MRCVCSWPVAIARAAAVRPAPDYQATAMRALAGVTACGALAAPTIWSCGSSRSAAAVGGDDAVLAVALGPEQRGIGGSVPDPTAEVEVSGIAATPKLALIFAYRARSDRPSTRSRSVLARCTASSSVTFGHDHQQFLAAIAADDVRRAQRRRPIARRRRAAPHRPWHGRARSLRQLEIVEIDHQHRGRIAAAFGQADIAFQRVLHIAPVVQPGQRIAQRLGAQLFAQRNVRQRQRHRIGQRLRQPAIFAQRYWWESASSVTNSSRP